MSESKDLTSVTKVTPESDDRFRLLVSNVRDYAIFLLDPQGIIRSWNAGAERLKGYRPEEIVGKHFSTFYTQPDIERNHPQNELKIAYSTGRYEEEGWRVRKDGTQFWANVVITRLDDKSGHHVGFAKITRDLTERKMAEEALRESEERFRLIVESVKDYAIIMLDPHGYITSWNEGARRLKGWEQSEIIGKHFSNFYAKEEIESGKCEYELTEAAATGRFEDEGWRIRKDGTKFWANVVITALRDKTGTLRGFAKVTRDMTDRKRAEDKLRMAHEGLERRVIERTKELRDAVEARDQFLSIASHELRTPLTILRLQNQLLFRQATKSGETTIPLSKLKETSEVADRQLNQLLRLVDDMLDVSRIATGRLKLAFEKADLSSIVRHVFNAYRPQFESAGIKASLVETSNAPVYCDAQRIEQVVVNLLSNAMKYGGGSPIMVSVTAANNTAVVTVSDQGPGINLADQDRIFGRFERATSPNDISGLGLGLFIVRQILEAHDGNISVKSEPGKGATFAFTLPLLTN